MAILDKGSSDGKRDQAMKEQLFEVIGSFGRWQKIIYGVFFYANVVGIWENFAMTFLAPNVPFRCVEPNFTIANEEELWNMQCTVLLPNASEKVKCTKWEYDTTRYSDTLVSKWDLVCDREWLISFAKSVFMIGYMASVFVTGQMSDWIGRRPTILACYVIAAVSPILSLFSTSIETFLIFRFLQAFGRTGFTTMGFVLLMEVVGPGHRTWVGISIQLGFSIGFSLLALVGYLFRHWFWFQVAIAVAILPIGIAFLLVPESPRWLMIHGKREQLKELIISAAKKNKIDLKEDAGEIVNRLIQEKYEENKGTILDLFRTPNMRWRTLNMMYLWVVTAFMYYALSFNTNDMAGDPYFNFLLAGALEIPSLGMLYLALLRVGRRTITVLLMLIGGASCLFLLAVPDNMPWLTTGLSQFGKFCVTASFALVHLYTGEMFPTLVRSAAIGSCSTVARIGSIVAPFSRELGKATHPTVPDILNSILAVSSGLLALRLPETAGRKLPDSLEEGENAFELKK